MKPLSPKERLNVIRRARRELKLVTGFDPKGGHFRAVLKALAELERDVVVPKTPNVPALGPIVSGGRSILLEDCTHLADGVSRAPGSGEWPSFDAGFGLVGHAIIAPEALTITDSTSSAQGGDAFYARGDSGIEYWIAHIRAVPAQGRRFRKGEKLTTISSDHPRPHVHLAVNAWRLLGRHLTSHTNYTHGAPTIGRQLADASTV